MNKKDFLKILYLPTSERYKYFVEKIAFLEELWGLCDNEGWAIFEDSSGHKLIPFWPKQIFAEFCVLDFGDNYSSEPIDIYKFVDSWLLELKENNIKPAIFYTLNKNYFVPDISILINDIKSELYSYR